MMTNAEAMRKLDQMAQRMGGVMAAHPTSRSGPHGHGGALGIKILSSFLTLVLDKISAWAEDESMESK